MFMEADNQQRRRSHKAPAPGDALGISCAALAECRNSQRRKCVPHSADARLLHARLPQRGERGGLKHLRTEKDCTLQNACTCSMKVSSSTGRRCIALIGVLGDRLHCMGQGMVAASSLSSIYEHGTGQKRVTQVCNVCHGGAALPA